MNVLHVHAGRNIVDMDVVNVHVRRYVLRRTESHITSITRVRVGFNLNHLPRGCGAGRNGSNGLEGADIRRVAHDTHFKEISG